MFITVVWFVVFALVVSAILYALLRLRLNSADAMADYGRKLWRSSGGNPSDKPYLLGAPVFSGVSRRALRNPNDVHHTF